MDFLGWAGMLKSGTNTLILHAHRTEFAPRLSSGKESPSNRNEESDSSSGGPAFRCLALGVLRTRGKRTTCPSEASDQNRGPTAGVLGLLAAIESEVWCDGISRLARGACCDGLRLRSKACAWQASRSFHWNDGIPGPPVGRHDHHRRPTGAPAEAV
jgi:hypothetical protein